jgi:hypothetical protein
LKLGFFSKFLPTQHIAGLKRWFRIPYIQNMRKEYWWKKQQTLAKA